MEKYNDNFFSLTYSQHPFNAIPQNADYKSILADYLAMSQAFPYLQAGSQKEIVFHHINNNSDIPEDVELTTVVGNFLCWDETGGLYVTLARGLKALPRILETRRFHANLLKKDCGTIFGEEIKPSYSPTTSTYLKKLYDGLSSLCPVTRVAYMVSFENHANTMIDALWSAIVQKFDVEKATLSYFHTHVGGDDPAEAYHVAMTQDLIKKVIKKEDEERFEALLIEAYGLHHQWCADIVKNAANVKREYTNDNHTYSSCENDYV